MIQWLKSIVSPSAQRTPGEEKYARAMTLTNEVEAKMKERAQSPDPFRALLAEIWLQRHDSALIADAFQVSQESRIYKGPL